MRRTDVSGYAQVIYQRKYLSKTNRQVADDLDYAIGTVRTYCYRFWDDADIIAEIEEKLVQQQVRIIEETQVEATYCVYVINGLDETNNFIMSKIGYSNNFNRRRKELLKANKWSDIELKYLFTFEDEEDARGFENFARKYYKKLYGVDNWVRNDRFIMEMTDQDLPELIERYKQYKDFCGD